MYPPCLLPASPVIRHPPLRACSRLLRNSLLRPDSSLFQTPVPVAACDKLPIIYFCAQEGEKEANRVDVGWAA
jgi:hypothetical protein